MVILFVKKYTLDLWEGNKALYSYKNRFCLIWKSNGVSFNKSYRRIRIKIYIVNNCIWFDNVNSFFEVEYKPKKIESSTNFIVYDMETFNKDRAVPYCVSLYRLSKIAGKYNRVITPEDYQKCKRDTVAFHGTDCLSKLIEWLVTLKGEPRKLKFKIVQYQLQLIAHNGSAFDTYVVLNGSSNWHRIVNIVKMEKVLFL